MPSLKQTGKEYWRSLDDLSDTPEFSEWLHREFPLHADEWLDGKTRRSFLKVMAASFALAGLTACRYPKEKIVAYTKRPEGRIPGVPVDYATAMETSGYAMGLLASSYDGRPIKLEGNPMQSSSQGSTSIAEQASILEMYDPERSQHVVQRTGSQVTHPSMAQFRETFSGLSEELRSRNGRGLCILCEATNSPTVLDMKARMASVLPEAKWFEYEPVSYDNERDGSRMIFTDPYRPDPDFEASSLILSLDCDFLGNHPAQIPFARKYVAARNPDRSEIPRHYQVEGILTATSSMADHRLMLNPTEIEHFTLCLMAQVFQVKWADAVAANENMVLPDAFQAVVQDLERFVDHPYDEKFMSALAQDLVDNWASSIILVGHNQPASLHALGHLFNALLSNIGNTIKYYQDAQPVRLHHFIAINELAQQINAGSVDTLLVFGGNPVFDAPADLNFADLLGKVSTSIHLSLYDNETSHACRWHVPRAHYLESWGDAIAYDGTVTTVQPLIEPLFEGKTIVEMLAMLSGDDLDRGYDVVRRTHEVSFPEADWEQSLHDGIVANSTSSSVIPSISLDQVSRLIETLYTDGVSAPSPSSLQLAFLPDSKVFDGRYANSGWMQELPDFLTKLTWDNAVLISPHTADELDITHSEIVELTVGSQTVSIPAYVMPGQPDGTLSVSLGYGRTHSGSVGDGVGVNVYPLRTLEGMEVARNVSVQSTGQRYTLACTQDHWAIDDLGAKERQYRIGKLIQEADHETYREHPEFAKEYGEHYPKHDIWTPPINYDESPNKWGMTIDLNSCIGCNACTIACQAENNIPIVGKDDVVVGREMHWIRVDRYFKGDPASPEVKSQPVTCVHCENAPCEQVCPVAATVHNSDGLNVMVYNRCVGTRYCANNCPIKVRRFNFFNYNLDVDEIAQMGKNPEVTIRARGVMEKCTFCVQRIEKVKIRAKNVPRPIRDGEVVSACAQVCPTQAITFGDLNDPESEITRKMQDSRTYSILDILYLKPRLQYLARVNNPNPALVDSHAQDDSHGHDSH